MAIIQRKLYLTGAHLQGKTIRLAGVQFVDGVVTLQASEDDIEGLSRYLGKSYQAVCYERLDDGELSFYSGERQGPVSDVDIQVPPQGGSSDDKTGEGEGPSGSSSRDERISAHGDGPGRPEDKRIEEALEMLDPDADDHWTDSQLPRVDALAELIPGLQVSRADIERIAPDFRRPEKDES